MKKETVIAIVLGIATGVAVAFFLIIKSQDKKTEEKQLVTPQISPTIKILQQQPTRLDISAPVNASSSDSDQVTIKGSAGKNALIVIHSATSEKAIKNTDGNFSTTFPLSIGENIIKITEYDGNAVEERSLTIYYLPNE